MSFDMKTKWIALGLGLLLCTSLKAEPQRVIFDTDITGDVDDVLALAMLHTMEDRGACQLLAVTVSKVNPMTGPFVDAVNSFYGRPDLPIGVTRQAQVRESRYLKLIQAKDHGKLRYPHDLKSNDETPDPVRLLRETLVAQPDRSVAIVQVGLAVNIARLLESAGDDISPLSGPELVKKKAKHLSIMAGSFETIRDNNHYLEANVINDIPSMQKLAQLWPDEVPVIWSGFEIGIAVAYPAVSIVEDFDYTPHHIVKEAYELYRPPPHERPTWDLTSVLYSVYPDRGYFDLSHPGRVSVADDGFTTFTPAAKGRDRFLRMSPVQREHVREALVQFVSQPPSK